MSKIKPTEIVASCAHCRHYRATVEDRQVLDFGECLRYPPTVMWVDGDDPGPWSTNPQVDQTGICGEFGAKQ